MLNNKKKRGKNTMNENLIATVNNLENFFKLKDLIGKTIENDGTAIATALDGLITEGTLEYIGAFRFFARNIVDNSEIEIVCRPTVVDGSKIQILNINAYGSNVR